MSDPHLFRQAWGKFATGVTVITTFQPDGEVHGMTANGICSVSLDPLLALVCAGHNTASYPFIKESKRFAINILKMEQLAIANTSPDPPRRRQAVLKCPSPCPPLACPRPAAPSNPG